MSQPSIDEFLLRHAPSPPLPVDARLLEARASISTALAELSRVPDSVLERPWRWRDHEMDVRYGFYRQYELLEHTRAALAPGLSAAFAGQPAGRPLAAAATAARWSAHGLLAGLSDDDLDADPGNGEWTVRQTLGHMINGQRAYGWFTAWWLSQRHVTAAEQHDQVPDGVGSDFPDEADEAPGSLLDVRRRLDDIVDLSAGVFAPLGDEELAARARWSGVTVDVRFRVTRWSSHMREHTIQAEKTLAMIGHPLTEVERLVRLIAAAWGRLEADLYLWPAGTPAVAEALKGGRSAAAAIATDAAQVRAAATGD